MVQKNGLKAVAALCLAALTALTAACSVSFTPAQNKAETTTAAATEAAAEGDTEASFTEPTEEPLSAGDVEIIDETVDDEEPASGQQDKTDDKVPADLTSHQWRLSAVYKDGEQLSPQSYYGSVIRQTGAYLQFFDDHTFQCVLGVKACSGTFTLRPQTIRAHITTVYEGNSDQPINPDEYVDMALNIQQGDISFEYFGVTNLFII